MSWRQPPMLILPPVRRRELPRDARSQIEWGLRYLRERYGRRWEGWDFGRYTREEQGMDTDRALERAVALLRFQYEKFTGPSRLSTPARELELICDALERLREEQRVAVRLREQIEAGAAQAVGVGAKLDEARERLRLRALDPLTPLADPLADRPVHRGYPGNAELSRDFASYLHDAIEQRVQRGALDDVVDAEVYCSVAGCGLLDGHAGPHRESSTERCGSLVHPLQAGALKVPQGQLCTRPLGHVGPHTSAWAGKWYAWPQHRRDRGRADRRARRVMEVVRDERAGEMREDVAAVVRTFDPQGTNPELRRWAVDDEIDALADRLGRIAARLAQNGKCGPTVYREAIAAELAGAVADAECRSQEAEASRAKPPGRERRLVTVEGALRAARSLMAKAAQSDVAGEDARWSLANRVVDALDRIGAAGSEPVVKVGWSVCPVCSLPAVELQREVRESRDPASTTRMRFEPGATALRCSEGHFWRSEGFTITRPRWWRS